MLTALLAAATVMTFCSPDGNGQARGPKPLRVSGAEVALPFIRELCDAFARSNPSARFIFAPPATTLGGINGVAAGELDIAAVSRPLSPREQELALREVWLALDPLILITNGVTVEGLTTGQVRDIYSGRTTNWHGVGGPDLPITVVDRPEQTSGKMAFREAIVGMDLRVLPGAVVVAAAGEVDRAVYSAVGAIGYTSRSFFLRDRHQDLRVIRVNGVPPDDASVRSGAYPAVRRFGVVVRGKPDAAVEAFLAFATSPAGRDIAVGSQLLPR